MKGKWAPFQWLFVVLILLATGCNPRPGTATPQPVVEAAAGTPTPASTPKPDKQAQEQGSQESKAMQESMEKCAAVQPGYACLVQGPVVAEAQPGQKLKTFQSPGDTLRLAEVQRMKLGSTGSTGGVVWLSIPADTSSEAFTVMVFGDVELTNDVPFSSTELSGMQALSFSTGEAEDYDQALTRGLMIDAPHDGTLNTLVINGVEMVFGSTAFITNTGGFLNVSTLFGAVGLNLPGLVQIIEEGKYYNVPREYSSGTSANTEPLRPLTEEEYDALERQYGQDYRNVITPETVPAERYRAIMELANAILWGERQRTTENPDNHEPPPPLTDEQWNALEKYYGQPLRELLALEKVGADRYRKLAEEANKILRGENPGEGDEVKKRIDEKKRMQPWKGGWWKMTPVSFSQVGICKDTILGVHQLGGDMKGKGEDSGAEIPICKGNNGNTILMYNTGRSYDRVGPNLYARSSIDEMKPINSPDYITTGRLRTLRVVSPTRMILTENTSEQGGCTVTTALQFDLVRDDPKVRCGKIIEVEPEKTPLPAPTAEPTLPPLPPVESNYTARLAVFKTDCDAQANEAAPDFLKTGGKDIRLSPSPDGGLLIETSAGNYLLALGPTFEYESMRDFSEETRQGMYGLEQLLDETYGLSLSLMQISVEQYSGSWQVTSKDGEQSCGGSVDLLVTK